MVTGDESDDESSIRLSSMDDSVEMELISESTINHKAILRKDKVPVSEKERTQKSRNRQSNAQIYADEISAKMDCSENLKDKIDGIIKKAQKKIIRKSL